MSDVVTVNHAAEVLGVTPATFMGGTPRYKGFFIPSEKNKKNAKFRLTAFLERQDLETLLTERVKLLVEYLFHIESIQYTKIQDVSGVNVQNVSKLAFGFKGALKIARGVKKEYPYEFERFDKYYGW